MPNCQQFFKLNFQIIYFYLRCLCWSPKGKQIVIGAANGSLSQYRPDLKIVKTFPAPALANASNVTIVNVLWISSFQFLGVYKDITDPSSAASFVIVNTPKTGTSYINYDDICYGSGTQQPTKLYIIHQQAW